MVSFQVLLIEFLPKIPIFRPDWKWISHRRTSQYLLLFPWHSVIIIYNHWLMIIIFNHWLHCSITFQSMMLMCNQTPLLSAFHCCQMFNCYIGIICENLKFILSSVMLFILRYTLISLTSFFFSSWFALEKRAWFLTL